MSSKVSVVVQVAADGKQTSFAPASGKQRDAAVIATAGQFYMNAASRGHILSLHR